MNSAFSCIALLLYCVGFAQCENEDVFVCFNKQRQVILSEDRLYTLKGSFKTDSEVSTVNEYTYNVYSHGKTIGRYFLDDNMNYEAALLDIDRSLEKKIGLAGQLKLVGVARDSLCVVMQKLLATNEFDGQLPALVDLGFLLHAAGYQEAAFEVLTRVLQIDSRQTTAHLHMADVLWDLKRYDAARPYYASYVALMKANGKHQKIPLYVRKRQQ